jgi:hypothetical protein
MKTLKYLPILAVFFALSVAFYSCSKNKSEATENVFDKISAVTNNYVNSINSSTRADIWDEIYVDVAVCYHSYRLGLIYDTPNNLVNSINDGLAASVKYSALYSLNPGNIDPNVGFSTNEYDYVGMYHVQVLDDIIKDESGIYIQDNDLNYENVLEYANQFFSANGLDSYSGDFTDLENSVNNGMAALEEAGNLVSNLVPNEDQVNMLLKEYFLALESSSSLDAFTYYSKTIEMLIIDSEEFSNDEKEYLLINMSTSRHDNSYWRS